MMHEVVYGKIFFERIIDAIKAALAEAGKIERGFAQRFAGNGAGVDATAAGIWRPLDDGDTLAKIRGLRAGLFSGGSAAKHNEVERIVGCQRNLHERIQKGYSTRSLEK